MPNKRKICAEHNNSTQNIYIPTLNSWYPIENVINSAYRKVLDFKENAEKILEKEKLETLTLNEFSKAILDSRSFNISLQQYCIVLKCYITLEKDKDVKKKRNDQTPPSTPGCINYTQNPLLNERIRNDSVSSAGIDYYGYDHNNNLLSSSLNMNTPTTPNTISNSCSNAQISSGGAKKVNVEVIMKSNPFRVDENEKTTRMELIRNSTENGMLRFTYYVKPEFEARKIKGESNTEMFENDKLIVFTNDFFTVYQTRVGDMEISLNEIVQSCEEKKRTEALGEKLCILLKDRPRHRALLTNECKLNTHTINSLQSTSSSTTTTNNNNNNNNNNSNEYIQQFTQQQSNNNNNNNQFISTQEDETFYTRELINIYGQPIVPSFHKYFNYQLSNTHYGYRTLRRLLNCDILKKFVKITKEEIKSLDRVVEFVQLTTEKCLNAFQINLTTFYDPIRSQNGIVKNWIDVWYVECLKEIYLNEVNINKDLLYSTLTSTTTNQTILKTRDACFLQTSHNDYENIQCDQSNHLWFCLQDYGCKTINDFLFKLTEYITFKNNKSELILVHTIHPRFEYKDVLIEARRILAICLNKSINNISIGEVISQDVPKIAHQHVESLLNKYINFDSTKKIINYTALFEILMILKRELSKEKNDEMKYSHFLCTLERANQEKLKLAITQLKCVPCLNKFTTNYSINSTNTSSNLSPQTPTSSSSSSSSLLVQHNSKMNMVSHTNMNRLLKQMSLIVSTELQQIAIDLIEKQEDDKIVKYIRLKDEFKHTQQQSQIIHNSQSTPVSLSTLGTSSSVSSSSSSSSSSYKQILSNTNNNNNNDNNNQQSQLHKTSSFISRNLNNELSSITASSSPSPSPSSTPAPISQTNNLLAQQIQQNIKYINEQLQIPLQINTKLNTPISDLAPKQPQQQQQQQQQQIKHVIFNPAQHLNYITNKFQDLTSLSTTSPSSTSSSNIYMNRF